MEIKQPTGPTGEFTTSPLANMPSTPSPEVVFCLSLFSEHSHSAFKDNPETES